MNMNLIIEWCNLNSGFAQVLLSVVTIIISIIAIRISIVTARLPFKKEIMLTYGSYINIGFKGKGIHVTATNVGNRNVYIRNLCLCGDRKEKLVNLESLEVSEKLLRCGETACVYFPLIEIQNYNGQVKKLYAFFEDSEGSHKYKYIGKFKDLCN